MNEEAGFIAALLAEPEDRVTLLVYADWLDERGDLRGEYLRLLASEKSNEARLIELRAAFDSTWVQLISSRGFEVNSLVKILSGPFSGCKGHVVKIPRDRTSAEVLPMLFARPVCLELPFTSLERMKKDATR
jgi:uncharacterized protein (TIGR02996 family)